MNTLSAGSYRAARSAAPRPSVLLRVLLACGIVSSLLYAAMNVIVPMRFEGYNSASQTVSELSAIDAPTRPLWVVMAAVYTLLLIAFGWGVRQSAGRSPLLRFVGATIVAQGAIGPFWPPMHQREVLAAGGGTLSDTLHIVFAAVWVVLAMLGIGFGAAPLGRSFRLYSIVTLVILIAFGAMTGLDAPRMQANLPTPWVGVWERFNIGVYLLWIAALAVALLRAPLDRANEQEAPAESSPLRGRGR